MINDVKLLENINEQDRAKEAKELTSNMHSKVLGIKWDVENDYFFFVKLHNFCDASEVALGACTYIRTINQDGKVHVALLASTARVAPIKGVTIPRLEISAAVEAAKLDNETRRFKTFVANRVTVIRQVSEANQWHHVSGEEKPADVLSRGCFVDNLPVSWFNGPPFLSNYKCAWPAQDDLVGHLQDEDPEVRRDVHPTSIVETCQSGVTQHPIDTLIEHYSSFYRLKKAVGWWLRLIQFLMKKIPQNSPLEIHELKHAENLIVKHVQGRAYFHETKNIEAGKTVLNSSSMYKLSPILIEGLLVVGSRLKHAALNGQAINPVILPHNHRLSALIVRDYHISSHVGVEWTLSQVRKKFWIIRGRNLVKRVKMDCMVCKRLYGAPMNQRMSDLPPERCEPGGPAFSLQIDAFINGFVRFTARRGYPSKVWSDNGTNLVGARAELARSVRDLDRSLIVRETRRRDVEWSFNPPSASHHGGVWERMIRSVRKVLFASIIKSPRMVDDVLQTLFCEAESIVNSRPLTKCSDDSSDESPLTPNHLLLLQENPPLSWGAFRDADPYRKHWRHVRHLAKQFWKRMTCSQRQFGAPFYSLRILRRQQLADKPYTDFGTKKRERRPTDHR
ncbi:uncharacterized protein LOC143041795 [Oratosquilla oratoria]|uniref:uncharacterized protein LOC143041795 n=1 Tax=Oratosquilla oratoria TaxID=337810 RepID=UPI003F75C371